jgi:hypothetical protein
MIYAAYVLTLHGPDDEDDRQTREIYEPTLRETEENLTDLMPSGWWVEIRRWDEEDGDERTRTGA